MHDPKGAEVDDTEHLCDIRCLGVLELRCAGSLLPNISGRIAKLLALLAVNANTVVSVDQISSALWEDPPNSSRQQVYNAVALLRRKLDKLAGQSSISIHGSQAGYRLVTPRESIDILRLQDLVAEADTLEAAGDLAAAAQLLNEALKEWRGGALTGISSAGLTNVAVALDEQHLAVAERAGTLHFRLATTTAPLAELVQLVRAYPYREPLRAIVMKLLHLNGRSTDALSLFEEGRRMLAEELGVDVGPLLRSAHDYVLTERPRPPSSRAADLVPPGEQQRGPSGTGKESPARTGSHRANTLPRDIPEFTGQEKELNQLISMARDDASTVVISAINGMGGVGKSTLAVHLAHKLTQRYPDGQLYIDLRGFSASDDPIPPDEALYTLLRDSGIQPEMIPGDLPGRVAMWRTRIADRERILLLLDNAASTSQIRPLLPGYPGPLVIISSRRRLSALEGAISVPLDAMPDQDALLLFSRVAGSARVAAEPGAARAVVRLCGRLPLAIQIAAARLRDRPAWSVAELVDRLNDHQGRLQLLRSDDREVMSIVTWSYRYLTPRQKMVFRLLSLYPGSRFDENAVARLTGLDEREAAECLEELFDINLVQQSSTAGYHLHDLVLDGARLLSGEPEYEGERAQAVLRMAEYHLALSTDFYELLSTHPRYFEPTYSDNMRPDTEVASATGEAMEILRDKHRGLISVIHLCSSLGLHRQAWQLTCMLLPYFMRVGFGADVDAALDVGLHAARADASSVGQSICCMGRSYGSELRGDFVGARDAMIEALELSMHAGSPRLQLRQRIGLGIMYMDGNQFEAAEECFTEALAEARRLGLPREEASLINNLGVVTRETGRFDNALDHFRQTLRLNAGLDRPDLQAIAMSNIAQIHYLTQNFSEADSEFAEALEVSRTVNSTEAEIISLLGLSTTCRLLGDFSSAIAHGRRGLELARETNRVDLEGDGLNALGDVYLATGSLEAAVRVFENALSLAAETDSARYTARAREGLAHVAAAGGDTETARIHWAKALSTGLGGVLDSLQVRLHIQAIDRDTHHSCWRCMYRNATNE